MPTLTIRTGQDTHVLEADPTDAGNASARFPKIRSGDELLTLLYMPVNATRIAGKEILTAELSCAVEANWISQTVTIQATEEWKAAQVTYNTRPALTGPTANSGATGALAAGDRFTIDIAALIQEIADGEPNHGWQLSTSQSTDSSTFRGFESGHESWTLEIEYIDRPDAPDEQSPEGVIGIDKWVVSVDDYDQLAEIQVQVDATPSGTNPDYDTGWVPVTKPKLDLAALLANALPASQGNAGTFDTDISGWVASNATLARVTTPTQAGAGALRLTATASADMFAASNNAVGLLIPTSPGRTHRVEGYSRAATTPRSTRAEIQWYDSAGVSISVTQGTASANTTSAYGLREVTGEAPAGAAYFRPRHYVIGPAAGEQHYWDTVKPNAGSANWPGLADAAVTHFRSRVKLLNGGVSLYGPWVEVTRVNKPTIVMDSPSGTDIWDPTVVIKAHLSPAGDANTRWQVIITDVADPSNQRYNSGDALTGATLEHPIPLRWKDQNVMVDDGTYRLEVRAWDRSDRAASQGDLPYARVLVNVTLDVDGTVTAPHTLTVTADATTPHEYPGMVLAWQRAADPDWFLVRRDGKNLATVDVDDYRVSPAHWEWEDTTADPNVEHTYTVRAVTVVSGENRMSAASNSVNQMAIVEGVWIRSEFGDVLLDGDGISDWRQEQKVQTFHMPYRDDDVDIITAAGGWRGTYEGIIDDFQGRDVDADRAVLEEIRIHPLIPVRLIGGTFNQWVKLRNLTVPPHSSIIPDADRTHTVAFRFSQAPTPADEG